MVLSQAYRICIEAEGADARSAWDELVARDESIALSKTPEWIDCICSATHFSDATLLFRGDDGRRLILPRLRKIGTPSFLGQFESPPQGWGLGADASGVLTEGGPASPSQITALIEHLQRHPGLRTRIMVCDDDAEAWASVAPSGLYSTARTAQVLDLRGGFSTVWSQRFTSKVRSNARKAERRGVVVESDNTGRLVDVFDALYRSSVDRWAQQRGQPLSLMRWRALRREPQSKFATVAQRMGKRCTVSIAWRDGEPLAGIVVLTRGPRATYWRGAMDKERARGTGANELLHRCAIEVACAEGRRSYDFGIYQTEELKKFKSTFGAHEVPVHVYFFEKLRTAAAEAKCQHAAKQAVRAALRLARPGR
jgi:hypothetical protein